MVGLGSDLKEVAAEDGCDWRAVVRRKDFGKKVLVGFLFIILLACVLHLRQVPMEKEILLKSLFSTPFMMAGSFLLAIAFGVISCIYFRIYQRTFLRSFQKFSLLVTIVTLTLVLAKASEFYLLHYDLIQYPLLMPFAAILICLLIGTDVALFTSGFLTIILGISLPTLQERFLVMNLMAALVAIISAHAIRKRKQVFNVCGKVYLSCAFLVVTYHIFDHQLGVDSIAIDLLTTFIFLFATALLIVGILPLLEWAFLVMTDMKLVEYMDPNHLLLRRMSAEIPGTYHHSIVVGNLSERAAIAIGANGLFCRVTSLYHDIGKLSNPSYFVENQTGGFNMHQLLTPKESAHLIIAHVIDGELLAKKHHLPQSFIDVIRQHHGTTLVYYFYCKQAEQGIAEEQEFRYPGQKPQTRESAIIMMADCVEAVSRTLDEVTEETLSKMVEQIVAHKIEDKQFDECPLTFQELECVKRSFIQTMLVSSHLRTKYQVRATKVVKAALLDSRP